MKIYYYLNGEKSLHTAVREYEKKKETNKDVQFVILTDGDTFLDKSYENTFGYTINVLMESYGLNPSNIEVAVSENEKRRFESDEWEKFQKVNGFLKRQGIKFGFEDRGKMWSLNEVENANGKILETADEIRKNNLSPYEILAMAYLKVTSRKYVSEKDNEHLADSRSVFGVLNSDKIVCVGFAELFKAIVDAVGSENIQIYSNSVACSLDGKEIDGYHRNLIVRIKDDKYGIDGFYYLDPTWDCNDENKKVPTISYFMVPLTDIDKIKYQIRDEEWSGLKDKRIKTNTKKSVTPKAKTPKAKKMLNQRTYNRNIEEMVSFTGDGFRYTEEFLKEIANQFPSFAQTVKETLVGRRYNMLLSDRDEVMAKQEELNKCYDMLKKAGITKVNKYKLDSYYVEKAIIDEEFTLVCCMDEICKLCECDDDRLKAIENAIENAKNRLTKEGYENYITKNGYSYDFFTYEWYISARESELDEKIQRKEKMLEMRERALKFQEKLQVELKNNPNLCFVFNCNNYSMYSSELYDYIKYNKIPLEEAFNKFLEEKYDGIDDLDNVMQEEMNKLLEKEASINKEITDLENMNPQSFITTDIIEFFDKWTFSGINLEYQNEIFDNWFKDNSNPIELHKTAMALSTAIKVAHPELSDKEVYEYVNNIIDSTCKDINYQYQDTATNAIMKKANEQKKEDEKTSK